jgi:hypothetical protein
MIPDVRPVAKTSAKTWVLVAAILGSAMTFIDGSAVNVALPVIQRELSANAAQMQWVVEGYALFLSALILLGGSLGDLYGRKRLFLTGIAIFTAASFGCAFAPNVQVLIASRCVQGIGAACAMPESRGRLTPEFNGAGRRGARAHQRDVHRRGARAGDRDVVRIRRDHRRDGARHRRLAHAARLVALGVPDQHPDRGRRVRHLVARLPGEPR